jgi:hypothetical protein
MKLTSILSPTSVRGNCGGDLRLVFTSESPRDFVTTPAPGLWQGSGNGAFDTYTLPTGDKIALNLNLSTTQQPGQLFVEGNISVTLAGGSPVGPQLDGISAPPPFIPGAAHKEWLKGRKVISVNGVTYDLGFALCVPWDGTLADCGGTWWAMWSPVAPVAPAPPGGLHVRR